MEVEGAQNYSDLYNSMWEDVPGLAGRLRLGLENKYTIPSKVAVSVFDEAVSFATCLVQKVCEVVSLRLTELGVKDDALALYVSTPELEKSLKVPINGDTKILKDLDYIEPVEIDLICRRDKVPPPKRKKGRPYMHYVPILKTLKSYLSHEDVMARVMREEVQTANFRNFSDGSLFAQHPLFSRDPHALRISLYSDEIQVCNPLGANTVKQKICVVYYQLQNIGNENLSSLESIHLASLVKWPYVLKFGYKLILEDLINDLKTLATEG